MKTVVIAVLATALLAGCSYSVHGKAGVSTRLDPTTVAGLAITTGPSGLRRGAPVPNRQAENTDRGAPDRLAASAVADVEEYWWEQFPPQFGKDFEPVRRLVSYDSAGKKLQLCGRHTTAFYCPGDDLVAWDRGELLLSFDDITTAALLAHEMGHAVQARLGANGDAPPIVKEQQADCFAGNYFRWVAEGKSRRFELSTGPGLNQVLATLPAIRDSAGPHGTAFDRVAAFELGFAEDPHRCAQIDAEELEKRGTHKVFGEGDQPRGNPWVDDQRALQDLRASLAAAFPGSQVRFEDSCGLTVPASYCPTGIVSVDVPALLRLSQLGDFAAFGAIASRYAVAVQDAAELPIEGLVAGQRTACLTGRWASTVVRGRGGALELSPNDLDDAIVELLSHDSLIAGDANGATIPSGFARVEAFRDGFLNSAADTCETRYPAT